jgi:hypothetical protein
LEKVIFGHVWEQWGLTDPFRRNALLAYALLLVAWWAWPALFVEHDLITGAALLVLVLFFFLGRMEKHLILFDIIFPMTVLTMWVAPACWYWVQGSSMGLVQTHMAVAKETYYAITIPGILAVLLGGNLSFRPPNEAKTAQISTWLSVRKYSIWLLAGIGTVCHLLIHHVPANIQQVFQFGSSLLWVSGLYLLFLPAKSRQDWWAFTMIYLFLAWIAIRTTMFGEAVCWTLSGVLLWMSSQKTRWTERLALGVTGALLLVLLLNFKYEYRRQTYIAQPPVQRLQQFARTAWHSVRHFDPQHVAGEVLPRVSQGYLTALAYAYVPKDTPFVNGAGIGQALAAAFVPRLFWPNKPQAGGRAHFKRFTGLGLHYACNIGPFGDAYVNYGPRGAALFLFFYAAALRLVYDFFLQQANKYPPLLLWLPIIFIPATNVEMDVATVANVVVKGTIFIFLSTWIMQNIDYLISKTRHDPPPAAKRQ